MLALDHLGHEPHHAPVALARDELAGRSRRRARSQARAAPRSAPMPASSRMPSAPRRRPTARRSLEAVRRSKPGCHGLLHSSLAAPGGRTRSEQAMGDGARYQVPASRPGGSARMRPLGFLTGVVLGSAASIALVLLMVVLTLALAASRQPAAGHEYPGLLASAAPVRHAGGRLRRGIRRAAARAALALVRAGRDVALARRHCLVLLACGQYARGMT